MYTKETLKRINPEYQAEHFITDSDVKMVNSWVTKIESSRDETKPMALDVLRYYTEWGEYYPHALIERVDENNGEAYVCEQPYVPFLFTAQNGKPGCSTSGGAWSYIPIEKMVYVGKEKRAFCDWGSCGACAHGAVDFAAEVNVWEYRDPQNRFGEFYVNPWAREFIDHLNEPTDLGYTIKSYGRAWKTEREYLAWLRTYKGVEFRGNWPNQTVVFYYRTGSHLLPREAWDTLELPTDTLMMNGTIMVIKYEYDDENKVRHEYRYANRGDLDLLSNYPYRVARAELEGLSDEQLLNREIREQIVKEE